MPVIGDLPIDKWKVTELKEELRKRKLSTAGLKVELVNRLKKAVLDELENDDSADVEEDTVGDVEDAEKAMETEASGMDYAENTKEKASETGVSEDNKIEESDGAETETCFVGANVEEDDGMIGEGEDADVKIDCSGPGFSVISRIEAGAEPEGMSVQEEGDDDGTTSIDENSKAYESASGHDGNAMEEEHDDHPVLKIESKHDGDSRPAPRLRIDDYTPDIARTESRQNDESAPALPVPSKDDDDDSEPVAIEKNEGHQNDGNAPVILNTEDDDPGPVAIEKTEGYQNDDNALVPLNTGDDDSGPVAMEKTESHQNDDNAPVLLNTEDGDSGPVAIEKAESHQNDDNAPVLLKKGDDDPGPVAMEKTEGHQNDDNAPVLLNTGDDDSGPVAMEKTGSHQNDDNAPVLLNTGDDDSGPVAMEKSENHQNDDNAPVLPNTGDDDSGPAVIEKSENHENDGDARVMPVRNEDSRGDTEKSGKLQNDDCARDRAENKGGDDWGRVAIGKSENDGDAPVTDEKRLASRDQVLPGGVRVKSDSLCINENNEIKDNITVHHVTLEVGETAERRQAPPSPVDRSTETKQAMDTTTAYSEKLNLDRSSGEDSMEEDAPETKQADSNYGSVGAPAAKNEYPPRQPEHNQQQQQQQPPKRKTRDGDVEILKRQRRWNPDLVPPPPVKCDSVKERFVPPSQKPATNSLRIDRFLRPFTIKAVHELLRSTGNFTSFWMDHIKTHCYVTYASVEEAVRTRNGVYNVQWPPNGGKLLTAEFVDSEEVRMKVEPPLPLPPPPLLLPHLLPPPPPHHLPPPPPLPADRQQQRLPPPPPLPMENQEQPLVTLDDLFLKTKTAPRIYYLPVSEEEAAARRANNAEPAVVGDNTAAAPVVSS